MLLRWDFSLGEGAAPGGWGNAWLHVHRVSVMEASGAAGEAALGCSLEDEPAVPRAPAPTDEAEGVGRAPAPRDEAEGVGRDSHPGGSGQGNAVSLATL